MQVHIEARVREPAGLRHFAARRLLFALRRLAWLVSRATVRFTDLNGPRGGIDKRCQVALSTADGGTVVATSVAADAHTALEKALATATGSLARKRARSRAAKRQESTRTLVLAAGSEA